MDLLKKYRVKPSEKSVKLSHWKPDETGGLTDKSKTLEKMQDDLQRLSDLQYLLYAESKRSVLVVLQGMDAGGKDGTVRHVMGPLNPQSCKVTSFKTPTAEELAHDFLWRVHKEVPRHGEIRVFNRSHYEDVLIVRVHKLVSKAVWSERYRQINDFERMLTENHVHILKFYLHISKGEQLKRLQKRLDDPTRNWKANPQDFEERKRWGAYRTAYEDVLSKTSTDYAPWFVIPADHKWVRNYLISKIMVETLSKLDMQFPKPAADLSTIQVK